MSSKDGVLEFLEELRSIAQLGLNYSQDEYDRERYSRLLEMASRGYGEISGLTEEIVLRRFQSELGHVTPKVGVNGAVFSESGELLLSRRRDDSRWEVPGGWVDVRETPRQAVCRELEEELGLTVEVEGIIDVFGRMPGDYGQPHTTCHLLFHCRLRDSGPVCCGEEVIEAGYYNPSAIENWHRDHDRMAESAKRYWIKVITDGGRQ